MPGTPSEELTIFKVLSDITEREGGYVNHPSDKGGPTKYGITLNTYRSFRGPDVKTTREDLKKLTESEAQSIYYKRYIRPFIQIGDVHLLALIADSSVHHGDTRVARWLQAAAGAKPDGRLGDESWAKIKKAKPEDLYRRVLAQRESFLKQAGQGSQSVFAAGWDKRMDAFRKDPYVQQENGQ